MNDQKPTMNPQNQVKSIPVFVEILEYFLIFFTIFQCNSMFGYAMNNGAGNVMEYLKRACLALTVVLFIYYIWHCCKERISFLPFLPVFLGLIVYTSAFYILNVRKLSTAGGKREYIMMFLIVLPMLTAVFWMQRQLGPGFRFFFQHANLVFAIAAVSLFLYILLVINPDLMMSDVLESRWYGTVNRPVFRNFYNFLIINPNFFRTLIGFPLYLNYGPFAEPLMFCIQLHTALFTEMFLRVKQDRLPFRWIILSVTIVTAQSTLCLILLAAAWGLKAMELLYHKGRRRLLAVPVLAVAAFGAYFVAKKILTIRGGSSFVLGQHMEDFYLGFRAFLISPVLGNGYASNEIITQLMTPERLAADPGLSNSVAMIPAQGGIVLSVLCFAPVLLCFFQIFRKKDRRVALWALGPFGMFAVTIFHYRVFMIALFAFGWSLLSFRQQKEYVTVKTGEKSRVSVYHYIIFLIICAGVLTAASLFAMKPLYHFLLRYQLFLGLSAWKPMSAMLVLLVWGVLLFRSGNYKDRAGHLACAVLSFAGFILLYPALYGVVNSCLISAGQWSDLRESAILILCYGLTAMAVELAFSGIRERMKKGRAGKRPLLKILAAALSLFAAAIGMLVMLLIVKNGDVQDPEAASVIRSIREELPESRIYANWGPLCYRDSEDQENRDFLVSAASTQDRGFADWKNASILFDKAEEIPELFNAGYQMAKISDESILYTNDPAVQKLLQEKDYQLSRYYDIVQYVSMRRLAALNGLERVGKGVLIGKETGSAADGVDEEKENGDYTYSFRLHLDEVPEDQNTVVCVLQIGYNNGEGVLQSREVRTSEFNKNGNATIAVPVLLQRARGTLYECLVLAGEADGLAVKWISSQRTPEMVTLCEYNSLGRTVKEAYFDEAGEPYQRAEGYYEKAVRYNRIGKVVQNDYLNRNGELTSITGGYAQVVYEYDQKGRMTSEQYFDELEKPALLSNGVSAYQYIYDRFDNIIEYRYYGQDGQLVLNSGGYAVLKRNYNEKHEITREWYFDNKEELCIVSSGYAAVEYEYDEKGNRTVMRYYDQDNKPVLLQQGYAEIRREYNEKGWILREAYYNTESKLCLLSGGYAVVEYEYDPVGNRTVYRYYDEQENPCFVSGGYSVLYRTYNGKRQIIKDEYGNEKGEKIALLSGQAATGYEFDEKGNIHLYTYYDLEGNITELKDGYSMLRREYNELRQVIRNEFLDEEGNLKQSANGVAYEELHYDERGNVIEWDYYNLEGKPAQRYGVYAQYHRVYNGMNRITEEWYSSSDGTWLNVEWGYAKIVHRYDEAGNETDRTYYNEDGSIVVEPV